MSNIGLNTNTFRITGKYIDLLNDFIVRAKVNPELTDSKKDQLLDFFSKIHDTNNTHPQFQLLSSIIERELRSNNKEPDSYLVTLMQEIENNNIEAMLPKIEFITEALDVENSEALAKIKGE